MAAAAPRTPARDLPLPEFFDPRHAEEWSYRPDENALMAKARGWKKLHDIAPSIADDKVSLLLLVDVQKDFCLPDGSLFVSGLSGRGAMDDTARLASFVYRNLARITTITCTLDTHLPHQIFFASVWVDAEGRRLEAHREVLAEDVRSGRCRIDPAVGAWLSERGPEWLERQVQFYCDELERRGRYSLYLWPLHCLLGSEGHDLVGLIQEARLFHGFCRESRVDLESKGLDRLTEYYSVLAPEVGEAFDGSQLAVTRSALSRELLDADRVIVAGQAASHCVGATLLDLKQLILEHKPEMMRRVYILEDCCSSVVVRSPEGGEEILADFTAKAEAIFEECAGAGMNRVRSTDRWEDWC